MNIGYARISKYDGTQVLDLQIDALKKAKVRKNKIYTDEISSQKDVRPGLEACLKSLREGDNLIVWKLDRLGRNLRHLLEISDYIKANNINLVVLEGAGKMDTSSASGKLMFSMFSAFAEYERELIVERTKAGLAAARARGRIGGRKPAFSKKKLKVAQSAMKDRNTIVNDLCKELGVARATLYKYVTPNGQLTDFGKKIMNSKK